MQKPKEDHRFSAILSPKIEKKHRWGLRRGADPGGTFLEGIMVGSSTDFASLRECGRIVSASRIPPRPIRRLEASSRRPSSRKDEAEDEAMSRDGPRMAQAGPKVAQDSPKTARDKPKTAQGRHKIAQDGFYMTRDSPKIAQHSPEMAQDGRQQAQDSPKMAQDGF